MEELSLKDIKELLVIRDGLKCSLTGDSVSSSDELIVIITKPIKLGDEYNLKNYQLIKKPTSDFKSELDTLRVDSLTAELISRKQELTEREKASFERENEYRKQIEHQKQELDEARNNLKNEYRIKELALEKEMSEMRESVKSHQQTLIQQEKDLLDYHETLQAEFEIKEEKIRELAEDLERDRERYRAESINNIQNRSNAYVNDAIFALDSSAETYHSKGKWWSIAGSTSLALGVATGLFFGVKGLTPLENGGDISWALVSFLAFKGVIVIGLFVALAKYCFTYSQSFTHEAIRNSERKHAINFGKFYLETYGAEAQWGQVKEAFEHWNINSSSAFSGNDSDKFDPKIFDKALEIAQAAKKFGKDTDSPQG